MAGLPQFSAGQKVLCFHGPTIYGAKCLKVQNMEEDGKPVIKYRIHYDGWNKNYDEWVKSDRMLEKIPQNIEFQAQHNAKIKAEAQEKRREKLLIKVKQPEKDKSSGPVLEEKVTVTINLKAIDKKDAAVSSVEDSVKQSQKRRKVDDSVEVANDSTAKTKSKPAQKQPTLDTLPSPTIMTTIPIEEPKQEPLTLDLPQDSQEQLFSDWTLVHKEKRLVPLPRDKKVNIRTLLTAFISHCGRQQPRMDKLAKETTIGIESIFNAALGPKLLYHFERVQYAELLAQYPHTPLSELYGGEHLLRLLALIPNQLRLENAKQDSNQVKGVQLLMEFLDNNRSTYLTSGYEMAPPPYLRRLAVFGKG